MQRRDGLEWVLGGSIIVPRPDDVEAYLGSHPNLAGLLPEICSLIREAVGPEPELSLELV